MKYTKGFRKTLAAYSSGAFGHDVFYAALSTYLIMFITSQLFNPETTGMSQGTSTKMIAIVSLMLFVLRFVELVIDPMIGGIIDNTKSRFGKFKPWILLGGGSGSICIILLFTDLGGLSTSNPFLYIALFILIFAILDVVYSFKDIAFWGMIPALASDSEKRESVGVFARIGSTLGQAAVAVCVVPIVLFFSKEHGTESVIGDKHGWLAFAVIVAVVSFAGAVCTLIWSKEQNSALRKSEEKTNILKVFSAIIRNDQLLWLAVSYGLFALGYVICTSFLLYYFTYVFGDASKFALIGTINLVLGFVSVALFPFLSRLLKGRKNVFIVGIAVMLIGLIIFWLAGKSLTMVMAGYILFFFPYPMLFVCVLLMLADSVEYGQLKTGTRSEGTTLCVRPLLDKLGGAISNGVVGLTAIWVSMTNNATPESVAADPSNLLKFKLVMFAVPLVLFLIAGIVFIKKVKLTESFHQDVLGKLSAKMGMTQEELLNDEQQDSDEVTGEDLPAPSR
ncbi:glycoside-pentoside-hexuronide (GPH):cation symporter [Dongshaea marina]|uniref:glycoside-pentoside-hexuronide (GPH):cation symporter n=1 Tax=Dongshaea marina TaxID=2047966 RepID=UPI000D3E6ED2|nr:glycoside-pentoside-hexuronide (GPH):cation symporter [Dongshaea marina]